MDVFKLLEKTNCKKCNKPTCLAFAAAVFQGQTVLTDCPYISPEIAAEYKGSNKGKESRFEEDYQKKLIALQQELKKVDLEKRAESLSGSFTKNRLCIKILGKDFSVDSTGQFSSDIHVIPWITLPVLSYILQGQGLKLTGNWVPFRELKLAADWHKFFEHQCTLAFKKVADTNPNFFEDIIRLFSGKEVGKQFDADISLVISPLPLLPILICYNKPEDGLESGLNLFFDETADKNLPPNHIYTIGVGLAKMFEKLAQTHG